MNTENRNISMGVLTLVCIMGLVLFIRSTKTVDTKPHTYYAMFRTVEGIKIGAPVYVFGVQVGQVSDMHLSDGQVKVTITADAGVEIPIDSSLEVQTVGLFAEKSMIVLLGFEGDLLQDQMAFMYTGNAVNVLGLLNQQLDRNIEQREAEDNGA